MDFNLCTRRFSAERSPGKRESDSLINAAEVAGHTNRPAMPVNPREFDFIRRPDIILRPAGLCESGTGHWPPQSLRKIAESRG